MTTTTTHAHVSPPSGAESAAMLRWDFLRGPRTVTCEVRVSGRGSYDVCVLPHWDLSSSVVERFDRPAAALQRHAEIAWYFRQAGFSVNHTHTDAVRHH